MKFFTPTLHKIGGSLGWIPDEFFYRSWQAALDRYSARYDEIQDQLPLCVRAFRDVNMHDVVIMSVDAGIAGELRLESDASGGYWPRGTQIFMTFHGVRSVCGLPNDPGTRWIYEEVDLNPDAAFELRVLADESEANTIEFSIAADALELRVILPDGYVEPTPSGSLSDVIVTGDKRETLANFYKALGFAEVKSEQGCNMRRIRMGRYDLFVADADFGLGDRFVVDVDSISACLAALTEAGFALPESVDGHENRTVVIDPDGRTIELKQYPPSVKYIAPNRGALTQ